MDDPPLLMQSEHRWFVRTPGVIKGRPLRYLLTKLLLDAGRPMSVGELTARCEGLGVVFESRPSKVVSDALRWEVRRGRVARCGRGVYRSSPSMVPESTRRFITRRVGQLRVYLAEVRSRQGEVRGKGPLQHPSDNTADTVARVLSEGGALCPSTGLRNSQVSRSASNYRQAMPTASMQGSDDNRHLQPPLPAMDVASDERTTLIEMLEYYRAVLARKGSGLTTNQLHTRLEPSDLTIGGLLHHIAYAEDTWFTYRFQGEPAPEPWASADWEADRDWEITVAHDMDAAAIFEQYDTSLARSRAVVEAAGSMDQLAARTRNDGTGWNLRWILVHMIEEYARHCGHADFIRQSIDGTVDD